MGQNPEKNGRKYQYQEISHPGPCKYSRNQMDEGVYSQDAAGNSSRSKAEQSMDGNTIFKEEFSSDFAII